MSALSVSTSAIASPRAILSPGCLSQRRILPSSIVSESLGIVISFMMVRPFSYLTRKRCWPDARYSRQEPVSLLQLYQLLCDLDDIGSAGERRAFEPCVVRHRRIERGDALDRRVQVIESGLIDLCRDLGAGA